MLQVIRTTEQPRMGTTNLVQTVQRITDIAVSGLLLLALLPLFIVVALLIRLDTPGPVLFVQKRVGKGGKLFSLYKFRSMVSDAESLHKAYAALNERNGPVFKIRQDPRVTRTGRFLRRFSLDELPQLINVLKGEMSLVGPRPALPNEVQQYGPVEKQRLTVTPGLTGLWQVSGRSNLTFEESVGMDLYYIEHQSIWLNFKILLRTVPAVIGGEGAY
jgi:exopolysaccharide biosynthesis polyprenyl glycosylphosphotransferase